MDLQVMVTPGTAFGLARRWKETMSAEPRPQALVELARRWKETMSAEPRPHALVELRRSDITSLAVEII